MRFVKWGRPKKRTNITPRGDRNRFAARARLCVEGLEDRTAPAAQLSITAITWNVVGLDSNNVTDGPDDFLAGARVCNTGDATATNVASNFTWDSSNSFVNLSGPSSLSVPSLAAGACTDFYYNIEITRDAAAYDTTRAYHITAAADLVAAVSTPTPRELYVEHLVSQNRNSTDSIVGPTTVFVGQTYTYTVDSDTATNGFEQMENFVDFPNVIFQILSVSTTYTAPPGATNDKVYADACGWDNVPSSGTYKECIGPENFPGGKVGGDMVSTYTVKILSAGPATVTNLIYDFSGSSYHYNSDFGAGISSITITAADPMPDAVNDTTSTNEDAPVSLDVTSNDSLGSTPTTLTAFSQGSNGTVSCTTAGVCTYTPNLNFNGNDSFTYTITDADGDSDTATVTITVTPVNDNPDAVDDSSTTPEDTSVTISVLTNDTDPDGDTLTITANTPAANGTVSCTASQCTYTPNADFDGSDSFTYTIGDGNGGSDTATVSITVTPVVDNPDAVNDSGTTPEDTPITVSVLTNDSDPDGDPISIISNTPAGNGSVSCTASQCTYTPNGNFNGTDSFTYTISDGVGTDTATVTITVTPVNDNPDAVNDSITTPEETPVTISVLANDTDPEGDTLTITTNTPAANGTVSCTVSNCTYTPNANFNGTDSFTYTITDGNGGSDTATVTITVAPVNDIPDAVDDTASTPEGSAVTINVLTNDTDPDGDTVTITVNTPASNGVVTCTATACTYTPNANFSGTDSFSYTISDGNGGSDTAIVTLTVTPVQRGRIRGSVYEDRNNNGVRNSNERGVAGVTVSISGPNGFSAQTTTASDGSYLFNNLLPGSYTVTEQPQTQFPLNRYFDGQETLGNLVPLANSIGTDAISVTVVGGTETRHVNFGERPKTDLRLTKTDGRTSAVPGAFNVYIIRVTNAGLLSVDNALVRDTMSGNLLNVTWTCVASAGSACDAASGTGNINTTVDLLPGGTATFRVTALISPTARGTLANRACAGTGSAGVVDTNPASNCATDTSSLLPSIVGFVYQDGDNDGVKDASERGIGGVTVQLFQGSTLVRTATTRSNGTYVFAGVPAGTYTIVESTQPNGFLDNKETRGNIVSLGSGTVGTDRIASVAVTAAGADARHNNFGELRPSSLSGFVYFDADNDGVFEANAGAIPERAIPNVPILLTGRDDLGRAVRVSVRSGSDGSYTFLGLRPGSYTILEELPAVLDQFFDDGKETVGTFAGGNATGRTLGNDEFAIFIPPSAGGGVSATGFNFGEIPNASTQRLPPDEIFKDEFLSSDCATCL